MEIVQSFLLSVTRVKLSVYEQRILTRIIEHGQSILQGLSKQQYKHVENPYSNEKVTIEMKYLLQGTKDYKKILDACHALMSRQFEFYDPEKRTYYADTIIHNVLHQERSGKVSFLVSRVFYDVMYNFTLGYKNYDLETALTLPTPYAVRLYVLLNNQSRPLYMTIENLKHMFGVENKYTQTADFIKRVIEPARIAIKNSGSNHFTYSRVFDEGKVTALRFFPVKVTQEDREHWSGLGVDGIMTYKALRLYMIEYLGFTHKELDSNQKTLERFAVLPSAIEQLQIIDHRSKKKDTGKGYVIGAMKSAVSEWENAKKKLPKRVRQQIKL